MSSVLASTIGGAVVGNKLFKGDNPVENTLLGAGAGYLFGKKNKKKNTTTNVTNNYYSTTPSTNKGTGLTDL